MSDVSALTDFNFKRIALSSKRAIDVVVALFGLLLLAPLMFAICVALWFTDGFPVIYRHARVGKGGNLFNCLKFRSMVVDSQAVLDLHLRRFPSARAEWEHSRKLIDDPRVTTIGKFLRKTSLDELPQLFNVLKGDMSLVGPRPIVEGEVSRYGESISHYLDVRPGITGLWQVSGRSDCSYAERVMLDVKYVSSWNFGLDISILFRTLPAVIRQRGSY